ncbi:oxidoreductase [Halalkalibacter akibai]|uniref:Oxidoreductase n=1 Tax=Halalkalibacter akibai (strain ATCC 43226 / DSM 21942 / CIP 109018 / JCM 9157 / 1139) TaxID=1236973 RepID=W4QRV6_HALA3|nr:oxidoreductase [Halalkalibacter akibai]GAE34835.1 oxidoreductase [Halalkalibacter akibai JCM 9157]
MQTKTALLIGATGLIGSDLLNLLLESPRYVKVVVLVRRPLDIKHEKLDERIIDFNNLENEQINFQIDDVYSCLGTTIKRAKSKDLMRKVDVEYPLILANLTKKLGAKHFLLVSALGANAKSTIFYSRIKGELEEELQKIGFQTVSIFRPSLLLGNRQEFRLGEKTAELTFFLLPFLFKGPLKRYKAIHSQTVAMAMLKVSEKSQQGTFIYSSVDMETLKQSVL